MKNIILVFIIFSLLSCKERNQKPENILPAKIISRINEIDSLVKICNCVRILFNVDSISKTQIIAKEICNTTEVKNIRAYMSSELNDSTCFRYDGTLSFLKDSTELFFIDFGLNPKCMGFNFLDENGKVFSFKMTYSGGQSLSDLHSVIFKR